MVSVVLPSLDSLNSASPVQLAVTAAVASVVAYKLLALTVFSSPPAHEQYAKKHGLKHIKLAKRLPNTSSIFGDLLELGRNVPRLVDWTYEKTVLMNEEPWSRVVPSQQENIFISSPELVEDVTKTQNDVFDKGDTFRTLLGELVGTGFTAADGENWFHQRRIASKFFNPRMYKEIATTMINDHSKDLIEAFDAAVKSNEQIDLSKMFHEFTLQAFTEMAFGLRMHLVGNKDGHPLDDTLDDTLPQIMRRIQTPMWIWKLQRFLNIGEERKFKETVDRMRQLITDMVMKSIEQSKNQPRREAATMVELFIHAMEDGERGITPEVLCDVAIMFVLGSRDTTADTMCWLLLMLSRHPEVEQKIRDELWEKVPEMMEGKVPFLTMEQTHSLTYMEAAIKETLRFYCPVPFSIREANRDTHLVDGTFVPKGCTVGMSPYVMGRLKSIWGDDVMDFKPERFIDPETGKLLIMSTFKFTGFHSGPRICIGMNLAMLEMKLVLATLMSRYRLDVAPNEGKYRFSAGLPLKDPLMARVRPVKPASA